MINCTTNSTEIESLLNAQEVADILNCSKPQVFLMARRGDFPVVRMGKLVRVRRSDLEIYIDRQTISSKARGESSGKSNGLSFPNERIGQK
jgi:excisionase family DNA binding protein